MKHGKSPYTSAVFVRSGTSTIFFSSAGLLERETYSPEFNILHDVNSKELSQALVNPEPAQLENLIEQAISTLHPDAFTDGSHFQNQLLLP